MLPFCFQSERKERLHPVVQPIIERAERQAQMLLIAVLVLLAAVATSFAVRLYQFHRTYGHSSFSSQPAISQDDR